MDDKARAVPQMDLKTIFAAELFSKLTDKQQDAIISQLIALLSHE